MGFFYQRIKAYIKLGPKPKHHIQGLLLARGVLLITHLFFADDSLLFAKASEEEMFQLISILNLYSKESGQKINLLKSCLIGVKFMSPALKSKLASILSIQVWDNLGK